MAPWNPFKKATFLAECFYAYHILYLYTKNKHKQRNTKRKILFQNGGQNDQIFVSPRHSNVGENLENILPKDPISSFACFVKWILFTSMTILLMNTDGRATCQKLWQGSMDALWSLVKCYILRTPIYTTPSNFDSSNVAKQRYSHSHIKVRFWTD